MKTRTWLSAVAVLALLVTSGAPALASSTADAPDSAPTFYKDVLPIIQDNCQVCHRPEGANMGGMLAPMAFMDYQSTRPWAKAIGRAVSNRDMPPWDASPAHAGVFQDERTLTEAEIATVVSWARRGAPAGNAADAPPMKEWPVNVGWSIGEPDLVLQMPEKFFVPDELLDETYYFKAKISAEDLPEDRWIKAVEFHPGSSAVHHIIATPIGGIAPGNKPAVYRDGYSALLEAGSEIIWNMHYHKEPGPGTGVWDQSSVAVIFYPRDYTPEHVLTTTPLGTFRIKIPPHEASYQATADMVFEKDSLINSMMPHMHLRGVAAKYMLYYPDGSEELLLDVPKYDFNWQTSYRFIDPKFVPAGTKVTFTGTWDNSADNPYNPDPEREITWGEATHEEMLFGWLSWTHPDEDATAQSGIVRRGVGRRDEAQDD